MAPIPIALVGYPVSWESLEQYRILNSLPEYDNESLVHNLETKINTPVKLVRVDIYNVETISNDCLCCFADFSGRPFEPQDLLDIPVPLAFDQLPQHIPVEGELRRLFAPRAHAFLSGVRQWVSQSE